MFRNWQEWQHSGRPGGWDLPPEVYDPARSRLIDRMRGDLHVVARNEVETRRFLAEEVYGVPEAWLDEVLRVRMTDLLGSKQI